MREDPWYAERRARWQPDRVRLLLVAESAPDDGGDIANRRFFYDDTLTSKDGLFREVVRALYDDPLLGAFFDRIDVLVSDDDLRISPQWTEINEALHEWKSQHSFNSQPETSEETRKASRISAEDSSADLNRLTQSKGLNKPVLVGCWHNPPWRESVVAPVPRFPVGLYQFSCGLHRRVSAAVHASHPRTTPAARPYRL